MYSFKQYTMASILMLASAPTLALSAGGHGIFGRPLTDNELAQMQGKFVAGHQVLFFGIKMMTHWTLPNGDQHQMGLQMNIDSPNLAPNLALYKVLPETPQAAITNLAGNNLNQVTNNTLNNVNGLLQNIQVAGDQNSVLNDLAIRVTDQELDLGLENSVPIQSQGSFTSHFSEQGLSHVMTITPSEVGYKLQIAGQGEAGQQLRNLNGHGGVQNTQLTGNLNQVLNQMQLTIQVSPRSDAGVARSGLGQAIMNLRGLN